MSTTSTPLRIGWAMRDVSTDKPITIPGQFHIRVSTGVLDPVTVTALVISNESDDVIFVSADIVSCRNYLLDEIRRRIQELDPSIPVEKIVLNATHTHTGPQTSGDSTVAEGATATLQACPHDGVEIASGDEYRAFFVAQTAAAVVEAWQARAPGGYAYGYGFAVVAHSRRVVYFDDTSLRPGAQKNPRHGLHGHAQMYGQTNDPMFSHYEAGADPYVNLLYTFDAQGELTGAIVNVPAPSQNSESYTRLSSSYWHETREAIRAKHGNIFILAQCAAAGDLAPRQLHYRAAEERRYRLKYGPDHNPEQIPEYERRCDIAERIAAAFDEVLAWARHDIHQSADLRHRVETVKLAKRMISDEAWQQSCAELERLSHEEFVKSDDPQRDLYTNSLLAASRNRLQQVIRRYQEQQQEPKLEMELHAIRLGDISFATNRFELFMDYQHRIQARSPFVQTFVVQLTASPGSGGGSYLATERGVWGRGYSASMYCNQVSPEGGQELVEETLRLLKEIAD